MDKDRCNWAPVSAASSLAITLIRMSVEGSVASGHFGWSLLQLSTEGEQGVHWVTAREKWILVIDLVTAVSVLRREKWAAAMKELMPKRKKSPHRAGMFLKLWHGGDAIWILKGVQSCFKCGHYIQLCTLLLPSQFCKTDRTGLSIGFLTLPSWTHSLPKYPKAFVAFVIGKDPQVMLTDGQLCSLASV